MFISGVVHMPRVVPETAGAGRRGRAAPSLTAHLRPATLRRRAGAGERRADHPEPGGRRRPRRGPGPVAAALRRGLPHRPARARRTRRAVLPRPVARSRRALRLRLPLRRAGAQRGQQLPRARPARGDDPVQHEGGREAGRPQRRRPGLAHRHELLGGDRARQRAACQAGAGARRPAARRHAVPRHARRLRGPARRGARAPGRPHGDPRLQQVLGDDAAAPRLRPGAADRGAAPPQAAGAAADLPRPPRHRAPGPLLQPRLRDPDRGDGTGGERRHARIPVPPPVAGEVPLLPPLDAGRRADVGQHRHHAQRGGRLRAGRAALHPARAGDGDARLRAPGGD